MAVGRIRQPGGSEHHRLRWQWRTKVFLVLDPVQPDPHVAFLVVNTREPADTPVVVDRLRQELLESFPEANGRVKRMWLGSSEPGLVEVRLIGQDAELLYAKGVQLTDALRAMPGIRDVKNDWENMVPRAKIMVDQQRARRAQVTSREVSRALLAQMDGQQITDYREGDLAIPVIARTVDGDRQGVGDLWNLQVTSGATGELVPLTQIADITGEFSFYRINRRNQERTLTLEFTHNHFLAPELLEAVLPLIDDLELPDGYRWEPGGEIESSQTTMGQLTETMPLAFGGIINNGIVLIDRIDGVRQAGGDPYEAIIDAAVTRLRPIIMATATTVFGLMPLILSKDALFFSMAINMASGLLFGTVLTLGVVPVLYAVLFRIRASD